MTHTTGTVISRRQLMLSAGGMAGGWLAGALTRGQAAEGQAAQRARPRFRYCLNMSTIRGQNLTVEQQVEVAAKAGYDAVEPWLSDLTRFVEGGGSLKDLGKRIRDHGLTVESAIGFARWIVDDDAQRAAGMEQVRREMDMLAQIGGKRMAAAPAGVRRGQSVELQKAAERYRQLLLMGDQHGVVPQIELWGGSTAVGRLSTAIAIAIESGHPKACFLGDVFHLYKGGSDFDGLKLLGPQALQVFHFNDYPADPPRDVIRDDGRVYPGDGVAPLVEIVRNFLAVGATPVLSLELFNRQYWKQDALAVARTGLAKMKSIVAAAIG